MELGRRCCEGKRAPEGGGPHRRGLEEVWAVFQGGGKPRPYSTRAWQAASCRVGGHPLAGALESPYGCPGTMNELERLIHGFCFLVTQRFTGHQNRLHAFLALLSATQAQKGFALQVKDILLCHGRNGRALTTCEHTSQVISHNGIMFANFAHK